MTFLKFLFFKLRNTSANYWTILCLRIFVRLLGISAMFHFLFFLGSKVVSEAKYLYDFVSTVFYILFFVFLDWYLKVSSKKELKNNGLKWLNMLKWIPLCFVITLVYLTIRLNMFAWPNEVVAYIIYSYTKVWPAVFVPNLSFIIITTLVFYTSAILKRNKDLKEENDLTI
jgi:hypothetical protein